MTLDEKALQLPFDFHRTSRTETTLAVCAFPVFVPEEIAAPDALFAASFGALLARYNGQSSIDLDVARLASDGRMSWRSSFDLPTTPETTFEALLTRLKDYFGSMDLESREREIRKSPAENSAAIILTEAQAPGQFQDSEAVLRIISGFPTSPHCPDLHLVVPTMRGGIYAAFVYNSNLFRESSIKRIAGHLTKLVEAPMAQHAQPISKLAILPEEERQWVESACTGRPRAALSEFVHRSFERHAANSPEAPAVRYREESLSYHELNARANALARYLAAQDVSAESRIAVCLDPSFDIAVALLAILKTGAVYVPLDPAYPAARIRTILEDVQPRLILTRTHLKDKIATDGAKTVLLDDLDALTAGLSRENLSVEIGPEQTAYIYYTSGTTGKPKGAMASQANLASYIRTARDRYELGKADIMPAIARFSFSISMFELMSPLAAGGTVVVLDRDHILDLTRMSRTLSEVTFFHAGPSLLKNLIRHIKRAYPDFAPFSKVRHASSGGDMVPPEVLEGLKLIFQKAEVFVIYGCSEISCMGCTYPAPRDRSVERTYVGRPFEGMSVRILDPHFNLLPVGVTGEICFSGAGVVKGYLNRSELTAEKFVDIGGQRFYRTGDMGRLSEDGWVEILGRRDYQVKLRGMRVELGEVEQILRRAPGVRDGVVAARTLGEDEKSLVAYVVMDREGMPLAQTAMAAVRAYMTEHLPDYMVPAKYVELQGLPLNHNMKIDRQALPEPEPENYRVDAGMNLREPRTPTEKRLAGIWKRLLKIDRVGLDDFFFDLGGHSALGMTMIMDIEAELGVLLEGMDILRESLEGQAALCDQRLGKAVAAQEPISQANPVPSLRPDFESFYFGAGNSLYGVLHRDPAKANPAGQAVLICSSIGQEQVRAHFVLHQLAKRLEASGVPTLRFDYYGCGDSLGENIDASCGRWREDIIEAFQELRQRTGASKITAVGVRFGAALLAGTLSRLNLSGLVLWDPICDGLAYYYELKRIHQKYARGSRRWRFHQLPVANEEAMELIGLTCSVETLREMRQLALSLDECPRNLPIRWLATAISRTQEQSFQKIAGQGWQSRLEILDFDPGWDDIARLDQNLPDTGVSNALLAMIQECHD